MDRCKPITLASVAGLGIGSPRIGMVAVGSAAGAMLHRLAGKFPDLYRAIEIDTQGEDALEYGVCADQTILIGEEHQKTALAHEARAMAMAQEPAIEKALKPFDLVVILAGMGGATGSGVAPLVADIAKRVGVLVVGVAITPFAFEGAQRVANASSGVDAFQQSLDTLFTLDNERLFQGANEGITQQIDATFLSLYCTISQSFHNDGVVGIDFADMQHVLGEAGSTAMGFATASGDDRTTQAVMQAIAHPLLGSQALEQATGIFVSIRSGRGYLEMKDVDSVKKIIRTHQSANAHFVYDANFIPSLGENLSISILATGIPNHD